MALPAPNLDDRRFQDLVDDAKRMVMRKCPDWTDHNVSDPGITLIETFAYMTDLMLYRLNRVPDRLFVKFLDLLGLQLFPAQPARTDLTFWLSAPATTELHIPTGTRASTARTEVDEPLIFTTVDDLRIMPVTRSEVGTKDVDPEIPLILRTEQMEVGAAFPAFSDVPVPGDTLLIALSDAAPYNAVALRFECTIEGVGVDPDHPPLVWEVFGNDAWVECHVERDTTGGLNREGEVVLHVPVEHQVSVIEEIRGGWVRARVIEEEHTPYSSSPLIHSVEAFTVGGTCPAVQAELIEGEVVGESDGTAGQAFSVRRGPIVTAGAPPIVETTSDDGWIEWEVRDHPYDSGENDRHVVVDEAVGEIRFGPALREESGEIRQLGAVPERGASIRIRQYYVGAGAAGNVGAGAVSTLKSSIPFVARVGNTKAATGGVDAEHIDNAKVRAPLQMRTRGRAVTAEDFELLTREASPEIVRVRCIPVEDDAAGVVRVLVVPAAPIEAGRIEFADLIPRADTLAGIEEALEGARLVGSVVQIEPPTYQGLTIVARLRAAPRADAARVQRDAVRMLHEYFNPLIGGPEGDGWPWGHPVQAGDAFAVLQRVDGVGVVEDVRLFGANPVTGERGDETTRLPLAESSLVFSYEHQIRVDDD